MFIGTVQVIFDTIQIVMGIEFNLQHDTTRDLQEQLPFVETVHIALVKAEEAHALIMEELLNGTSIAKMKLS